MTDSSAGRQHAAGAAAVVAVAAAAGAVGIGLVLWHTKQRHTGSLHGEACGDTNQKSSQLATQSSNGSWFSLSWPWTSTQSSLAAIANAVAAERLKALARTSEAIESAARVPLGRTSSLATLAEVEPVDMTRSGSMAGHPFTDADLPGMKFCSRRNGRRWVLGGRGTGKVLKVLRGGVHPIAVREFMHKLSEEDEQELRGLVERLMTPDGNVVKSLGIAKIPRPGIGYYIASQLYERGSLEDALDSPKAADLLWYKKRRLQDRLQDPQCRDSKRELGCGRQIALAIARGLHWLHLHDIVHQDLRPSKVLLGHGNDAKLADAGLARFAEIDYMAAQSNVGPFSWMAPEVMWGQPATSASDIYSFGVLLWQLVTGLDPRKERRRRVKVPEACPHAVSDLLMQCLDRNPEARPTAGELVALLGRPPEALPVALRPRAGSIPHAGAPMFGGKKAVWDSIQEWAYTVYGGKEAAFAAGYQPGTVDDILDAREWDVWYGMIEALRKALADPKCRTSGSPAHGRIYALHRILTKVQLFKLYYTAEQVREDRFAQMESLESLESLAVPDEHMENEAMTPDETAAADDIRVLGVSSAAITKEAEDISDDDSCSSDNSVRERQVNVVNDLELTADQVAALIAARRSFRAAAKALARERTAMVHLLHGYATGTVIDHERAVAASNTLRANIMEEGRQLHSFHMWFIGELLSPWQWAKGEVAAFPSLMDPILLADLVAARATTSTGSRTRNTWQPIIGEGKFMNLRCAVES